MLGTSTMAKPKKKQAPTPESASRITIINLKGSAEQSAWLEAIHKKTHISKSVIVRLALSEWADKNGHQPFPMDGDGEDA
jgi:hypothetical protein